MIPDVAELLGSTGLPALLAMAFAGGLLLSATPCVYPMIPVTVAAFGAQHVSRTRAVGLALLYVAGIALTYAALGVWAAATGRLFGSALADPRVTGGFAALFGLLAAVSFGWLPVVERALAHTPQWAVRMGGASPAGALAMGLVAGIVFAPCVGPFVVGVLAHVAATGELVLGGVLLASVGLGMGTPFVALAVFSGELSRWPRAGALARLPRFLLGGALLVAALYYASLSVAPQALRALAAPESAPRTLVWRTDAEAALAEAQRAARFAVVDFTADWCLACHELERVTFRDPEVASLLADAELIRVDATRLTPPIEALFERLGVAGLPAVVVVDPDGHVVEESRIVSFVPPEEAARRFRLAGLLPHRNTQEKEPSR